MSDRPTEPLYNRDYYNPHYFPEFDPPFASRKLDDEMYAVSGRTRAKNHLITIARDEFLLWLLADERMTRRLQAWSAIIGLPEIINNVAVFLDQVADWYGFSRRADIGRIPRPPHISIEDFLPEWCTLQDRLYAAYRRFSEILKVAFGYVRDELDQPWRWLGFRLTHRVFQHAWEDALGIKPIYQRTSYLDPMFELRGQSLHFVFEQNPSETNAEARKRLMAEARAARADSKRRESESPSIAKDSHPWNLPKGSPRKNQQDNAIQDAQWLYRQLICGDTPAQIAKSHHDARKEHKQAFSNSCGCRQRVDRGLRNALLLLDGVFD
jgi:hypothetical protein